MIRWITPFLGTAPAGSADIEASFQIVDVRDLVDKHGNNLDVVRRRIDNGVALLNKGLKVVVCCDYGISRSNSIAAGMLSLHASIPFDAAVRKIRQATGEDEIKLEPLNVVRAALNQSKAKFESDGLRVLITGGSGFMGSALQQCLYGTAFVIAPSRQEADLSTGAVALDLIVKEHRINTLVHLANPRVYTSAKATGDAVTMLRNVLDVCRENRLRLIYPSSWETYSGYKTTGMLANESLPLFPRGVYGEAKFLCETLIEHFAAAYDLNYILLRMSPVYGVSNDRPKFLFNFIGRALNGDEIVTHKYKNGDPSLDLIHIKDAISAINSTLYSNYIGGINIGSGISISTKEVAELIVNITNSRSPIKQTKIEEYYPNITMDISRAQRLIGWSPAVGIERGIREIISKITGGN